MQSDEAFEAWGFLNHIAMMLYYKIFNVIKSRNQLGKISSKHLLMSLIDQNTNWNRVDFCRSATLIADHFQRIGDRCYVDFLEVRARR